MDFTLLLIIFTFLSGLLLFLAKLYSKEFSNNFIDFLASFFPILLFVLIFRSFIIEPYRIPSGSMIPTLLIGDFILVKKYEYGIRIPITNYAVIDNNKPKRGDVIVFQYPQDKRINYIKRVVALPGDFIEYLDKIIYINGKKYMHKSISGSLLSASDLADNFEFSENNGSMNYNILKNKNKSQNFSYKVPENSYFVLGDNRDNSNDSRYWGPVPEENLIGKAFYIWMYWNPDSPYSFLDRIGSSIK